MFAIAHFAIRKPKQKTLLKTQITGRVLAIDLEKR